MIENLQALCIDTAYACAVGYEFGCGAVGVELRGDAARRPFEEVFDDEGMGERLLFLPAASGPVLGNPHDLGRTFP